MKNIIIVDIDTERTPVTQIGKMEGSELPKNPEDAKDFVIKDMACLTEGLCTLINAADQSGIKTIKESIEDVIRHLEGGTSSVSEEDNSEDDTIDNDSK